ncbi:MAG: TonB-dependent receptor plug domain-containing protein [Agriterribacter sp.]
MKKMRIHLLLLTFAVLMSNYVLSQQKRTVSGNVSDETGAALPGVSIAAKGGATLTATDAEGHFSVSLSPSQHVLVFSSVGFETLEVNVASQTTISVTLKSAIKENEAVVVTALGVVKQKRQLGFSITDVKGAELSKTNEVNPINALQGRVAGVQIDMGGAGGLTANSKIIIRGNSTLKSNNQPIFVIDGVIMDNDVFSGSGRDFGNDLKNLNMEDFESVSVLKGSAAAALYGTRAVNGVILITTKKGKARKGIGVSVSQSVTVTDPYAGPIFKINLVVVL